MDCSLSIDGREPGTRKGCHYISTCQSKGNRILEINALAIPFETAEERLLSVPTAEELGASSRILSGVSLQEKGMASLLGITLLSLIITKKEIFLFHQGHGILFPIHSIFR